jgi:hypothetical protein
MCHYSAEITHFRCSCAEKILQWATASTPKMGFLDRAVIELWEVRRYADLQSGPGRHDETVEPVNTSNITPHALLLLDLLA